MQRLVGYRTVVSAVALAIVEIGVELGWWSGDAELVGAVESLLVALVVIFASLKVQRLVVFQETMLKRSVDLAKKRLKAIDAEEEAKRAARMSRPARRRRARALAKKKPPPD